MRDAAHIIKDFICIDLVELLGTRSKREFQNDKFFPTWRFEPTTFRLQVTRDNHYSTDPI